MNRANVGAGIVCLAFAILVYWLSGTVPEGVALDPLGGRFLPRALAVGLGLFALALTVTGLLGVQVKGGQGTIVRAKGAQEAPSEEGMEAIHEVEETGDKESGMAVLAYAAAMGAYVWLLPITGFLLTSFVMFSIFVYLLGQKNIARAIFASAVITGGLYGLFGLLFDVRLPVGTIF